MKFAILNSIKIGLNAFVKERSACALGKQLFMGVVLFFYSFSFGWGQTVPIGTGTTNASIPIYPYFGF